MSCLIVLSCNAMTKSSAFPNFLEQISDISMVYKKIISGAKRNPSVNPVTTKNMLSTIMASGSWLVLWHDTALMNLWRRPCQRVSYAATKLIYILLYIFTLPVVFPRAYRLNSVMQESGSSSGIARFSRF